MSSREREIAGGGIAKLGAMQAQRGHMATWFDAKALGWVLPPPTQEQSILGVLLRAIYNHSILIIQLLLRGAVLKV